MGKQKTKKEKAQHRDEKRFKTVGYYKARLNQISSVKSRNVWIERAYVLLQSLIEDVKIYNKGMDCKSR